MTPREVPRVRGAFSGSRRTSSWNGEITTYNGSYFAGNNRVLSTTSSSPRRIDTLGPLPTQSCSSGTPEPKARFTNCPILLYLNN